MRFGNLDSAPLRVQSILAAAACALLALFAVCANAQERHRGRPAMWARSLSGTLLLCAYLLPAIVVEHAHAAIPASERAVLMSIYASTNGAGWLRKTNWNGAAGTECTWDGVQCDPLQSYVRGINLGANNLTGSLPSLAGLTNLELFSVEYNAVTGSIPALTGLTNLQVFSVQRNRLTGPIPSLTGLTRLRLVTFNENQLTGTIPSPAGLSNLTEFYAFDNQLSGPIPSLSGLASLRIFSVEFNQLTGPIPPLAGLSLLQNFRAWGNRLTGTIPSLAGLGNLERFDVASNQLTGTIPSLSGLTKLQRFSVGGNQLSGDVPAPPSPSALLAAGSGLCPNYLNPTPDASWDIATGSTPWYAKCTTPPVAFSGITATGTGTATASLICAGTTSCSFARAAWLGAPGTPGGAPVDSTIASVTFPHGTFDFTVNGGTPGFAATLALTFPQSLPPGTRYYKFGPTASDPSPHWYQIPAVVNGKTVTFSITDGGLGDDDLAANGHIEDAGGPASHLTVVVEYYHEAFDHYFITANPPEIAKLDDGTFAGWTRTGFSFTAYPRSFAGAASVCRFFSTAFGLKSSHFYTPFSDECAKVKGNPSWQFEAEGDEVFHLPIAAGDGSCAAGTAPVYRLFNEGQGGAPNHRYTTSSEVRGQMEAKGWVLEGNGPHFAFMCSPL